MSQHLKDNLADLLRTAAAALLVTLVAVAVDRLLF